jgi:hypothetical protein
MFIYLCIHKYVYRYIMYYIWVKKFIFKNTVFGRFLWFLCDMEEALALIMCIQSCSYMSLHICIHTFKYIYNIFAYVRAKNFKLLFWDVIRYFYVTYVYIYIYVYIYAIKSVFVYMKRYMYVNKYTSICIHIHLYTFMYFYLYRGWWWC